MCIACAINHYPEEYTRRQKLRHKKRIMEMMNITCWLCEDQFDTEFLKHSHNTTLRLMDKRRRFEEIMAHNKPVEKGVKIKLPRRTST